LQSTRTLTAVCTPTHAVPQWRRGVLRPDLRRLFEYAHRLRVRRDAERSEVPRRRIDIADLGRPDDLPFGVGIRDLFSRGDVARAHPLAGDGVGVAKRQIALGAAWQHDICSAPKRAIAGLQRRLSGQERSHGKTSIAVVRRALAVAKPTSERSTRSRELGLLRPTRGTSLGIADMRRRSVQNKTRVR
jgi:hypothetical protein